MNIKSPAIILVEPQMGENIGAAARAMKNFGLTDFRIVNPRDGWPNEKAISMAAGGMDIVENAEIFNSLKVAISDIEFLYATTANARDINKDYIKSKDLKHQICTESKVGIMFGRESSGLSNEELILANKIITIDTSLEFPSLNIAQAVLIIAYEIMDSLDRIDLYNNQNFASKSELDYFLQNLFSSLEETKFFKVDEKKKIMKQNMAAIFSRIDKLSKSEVNSLIGMVNSLKKR